jgi:hypothetical protein
MKPMEDRIQYLKLLKPIRRQMLLQLIVKESQVFLVLAAALSFLLITAARFIAIPFLSYYFWPIILLSLLVSIYRIWEQRPGMAEAAALYNRFVAEDRVITSFSFLQDEGIIARLQLADTVKHMKKVHDKVLGRKKISLFPKPLSLFFAFFAAAVLLYLIPSENIELAHKQEKEIKLVEEAKKELEKKAEKEKNPAVKNELETAKDKIAKKKSAEEALKELAKQTKSLELKALKEKEKSLALENMKSDLNKNGLDQLSRMLAQKDMAAFEKELSKLNDQMDGLSEEQKKTLSELTGSEEPLSEEELSKLLEQLEEAMESEELLIQLAAAQQALQNSGLSLQQQMAANGMPPGQLAFAPPGQPGSQGTSTNSQQGQKQNNSGQQNNQTGNNSSSGNGSGTGTGSGSGTGSRSGSGSGSGTGSGSGLGGGAGLGQGSRELLTIPSHMEGQENIENDNGTLGEGNSGQQFEGDGPVLKGSIRSYSEVFGSYEKAYRQSTDRYKLPADLEEIVKNYFTSIDPDKE